MVIGVLIPVILAHIATCYESQSHISSLLQNQGGKGRVLPLKKYPRRIRPMEAAIPQSSGVWLDSKVGHRGPSISKALPSPFSDAPTTPAAPYRSPASTKCGQFMDSITGISELNSCAGPSPLASLLAAFERSGESVSVRNNGP